MLSLLSDSIRWIAGERFLDVTVRPAPRPDDGRELDLAFEEPCGVRDRGRDEAVRGRLVYLELVDFSAETVFGTFRVGPMFDDLFLPQSVDGICPKDLMMLVIQKLIAMIETPVLKWDAVCRRGVE